NNKSSVTTYTSTGKRTTPTITVGIHGPAGVAVDANGKIYVSNTGSGGPGSVTTYKPNGSQSNPTIIKGLDVPEGVAVGANGEIYVANYEAIVTTYASKGKRTKPTIKNFPSNIFGIAVH
ncbi:MAG: hypothetical protein WBE35_00460, partial [Candidatus Cybelea sp.]